MQVVGADKLAVFLRRADGAAGALRAFHALAAQAEWKSPDDIRRQFGAIARFADSGKVQLTLPEHDVRIALQVNYALGLMRIDSVETVGDPRPTGTGDPP